MEEMLAYDDAAAVAFIKKNISQDLAEKLNDDEVLYLIDLIYDYYESRGYLDMANDESEEVVEIDEDELLGYVVKNARKDEVGQYNEDDVRQIVMAEMAYCESIGLYDED